MASDDKKTLASAKSNEPSSGGMVLSKKVLIDSLVRLSPKSLLKNIVMLIVEITFFIVAAMAIVPQAFGPVASVGLRGFYIAVATILLITVWFSTLSDALAEQQAKSTAGALRKLETEVPAKKIVKEEWTRKIVAAKSTELRKDDLILIEKGDVVPLDADILEGIAMVDESLVTGESAPVRKAPGDSLIGGSRVVSDSLTAKVTTNPGETFIDQMIKMVESSKRPKTPNEVAVTIVLIGLTAIFTIIIVTLLGVSIALGLGADLSVLIALYVCLLPTTIGALLPAIGLSGMSRLYKSKIVAKSGKAIETAGDADVVLLDKTGTITVGNRQAIEFVPFERYAEEDVGEAAFLSSWHDDTPEGRSILNLAYEKGFVPKELNSLATSEVYPFSATTRTSGVKITHTGLSLPKGGRGMGERTRMRRKTSAVGGESETALLEPEVVIMKGAPESIKKQSDCVPTDFDYVVNGISAAGETPIAVARNGLVIGIIRLKDVLKEGIKEKIQALKVMGIRPVMITGDQPLTAKSIASEVGMDEYVAQTKPEDKYNIAKREQAEGRIVAMIGDGSNDAPALAAADVGLAMNSGTEAAKEAANMVDLESNPAKIIDVVMLGKQLLMTRGAVTAFSIANDVSKYFAIMPFIIATALPALGALNILHLHTMQSAVLSALIFNAIIIPLLIPLAMRGIAFKPTSTMTLFLKNTLIYGVGGVIVPFVGIKLIDLLLSGVFHI
jgi:K+-transporting ATPase ATPase B chain